MSCQQDLPHISGRSEKEMCNRLEIEGDGAYSTTMQFFEIDLTIFVLGVLFGMLIMSMLALIRTERLRRDTANRR